MCAQISVPALRLEIESALASRIASALTPAPRLQRPLVATGIASLDSALYGGLPVGAIREFVGPECSGSTAVALSFLAQITHAAKVCAWIDVSNALDPASAAAIGVDLDRLLWVRCGNKDISTAKHHNFALPSKYFAAPPIKRGLHGGGFGSHPRSEVKGLPTAVGDLLSGSTLQKQSEDKNHIQPEQMAPERNFPGTVSKQTSSTHTDKPWSRIEQALRATDLLLQGGGFSAIVVDMGSLSPEFVSRIPLTTWFRFRAAAERTQSSIVLLTQYSCAKSSVELLLQFHPAEPLNDETTVFTGVRPSIEVMRRRFERTNIAGTLLPLRKPAHSTTTATWHSRAMWAICR